MRGVVTKVILSRGFGFIRDAAGMSRFFHKRAVVDPRAFDLMHEGQLVQFTPDDTGDKDNGLKALDVEVLT